MKKKSEVVDAWYYDLENRHHVIHILDAHDQEFMPMGKNIILYTRDGELTISPGDYVIKGVAGNFYNCKESIFHQNYEIVTEC